MKNKLTQIELFFKEFPEASELGKITQEKEFDNLDKKVKAKIPDWYKEVLLNFPLANLEMGIPNDFGQDELKGLKKEDLPLMRIQFYTLKDIEEQTLNYFPGYKLIKRSIFSRNYYLPIAIDNESTQENLFISCRSNSSLYLVFHDMGTSRNRLISNSEILMNKFDDIFRYGKILNENRKISIKKLDFAFESIQKLIDKFESDKLINIIDESADLIKSKKIVTLLNIICNCIYDNNISITQEIYDTIDKIYIELDIHQGDLLYLRELINF